jgi:hypothetical protein
MNSNNDIISKHTIHIFYSGLFVDTQSYPVRIIHRICKDPTAAELIEKPFDSRDLMVEFLNTHRSYLYGAWATKNSISDKFQIGYFANRFGPIELNVFTYWLNIGRSTKLKRFIIKYLTLGGAGK